MRLINQYVRPATSPTFEPTARLDGGVRYLNWLGGLSWSGLPVPGGWRCQAGSCGQLSSLMAGAGLRVSTLKLATVPVGMSVPGSGWPVKPGSAARRQAPCATMSVAALGEARAAVARA